MTSFAEPDYMFPSSYTVPDVNEDACKDLFNKKADKRVNFNMILQEHTVHTFAVWVNRIVALETLNGSCSEAGYHHVDECLEGNI